MQIDVSPEGLRALLEPKHGSLVNLKWHPIEYLPRVLCDYEKRCGQIEKHTLSLYSSL